MLKILCLAYLVIFGNGMRVLDFKAPRFLEDFDKSIVTIDQESIPTVNIAIRDLTLCVSLLFNYIEAMDIFDAGAILRLMYKPNNNFGIFAFSGASENFPFARLTPLEWNHLCLAFSRNGPSRIIMNGFAKYNGTLNFTQDAVN